MKRHQVLLFILGVFALLGIAWAAFPAGGVNVAGMNLRFLSYAGALERAREKKVDVDSVMTSVYGSFSLAEADTLSFYKAFFQDNANRIWLPDDDYTWFDRLFAQFDRARSQKKTFRVAHYGDSQIELDRMSSNLREALQERFGGLGTGMFPALTNVNSSSIAKSASGSMTHFTMYGDSTTVRAPHRRYGVMAQLSQVYGPSTVSFRALSGSTVKEHAKSFSRVSVLIGNTPAEISVSLQCDTFKLKPQTVPKDSLGVHWLSWDLPRAVKKGTIRIGGRCELYGVAVDDARGGVAVDNIPLRGCSGTIFTRISQALMKRSFALDDTRLIILQFGGNSVPYLNTDKSISTYMKQITQQLDYFHQVAPDARILFIGPSDMCRSVNGKMQTYPRLPDVVDSLRTTVLAHGDAFWDMFHVMGGENSMPVWVKHSPQYAGPDYIHFTTKGADFMGETLASSLLVYYDFYKLRKTMDEDEVRAFMRRKEDKQ